MTLNFSSSDRIVDKQVQADPLDLTLLDCHAVFEIDRCVAWIKQTGLKRVGLQFPDSLLHAAPAVCKLIQASIPEEVFILGDTSFGECCVDEVAAAHLNADGVIHFGHTCLTEAQNLPVLYIYTRRELDLDRLRTTLTDQFDPTADLLLLYDVEYHHCLRTFHLSNRSGRCIVGVPCSPVASDNSIGEKPSEGLSKFGRRIPINSWSDLGEGFSVVFVTKKSEDGSTSEERLLSLLFTFSQQQRDLFVYEVTEADGGGGSLVPISQAVGRLVRRRYFLVEKARDAERVGILVGTLGCRDFPLILERLRQTVRRAGKRCYTFLLGKPNTAKLANFPEIDVFVLVACPETSFPDTREFLQPIITPYELEVACDPSREWCVGDYHADFRSLLPGGEGYREPQPAADGELAEEREPDVSLITGRLRTVRTSDGGGEAGGELAVHQDRTVALLHQGGGGQFLASRSWSGLDQALGQTPVKPVGLGQTGLAAGYAGEPGVSDYT